jgi:dipeptidyl aminopeptidase/acylaminoacyl peptidase
VLIHGTDDGNVPYEISSAYHQAAIAAGDKAELVTLEGAGHFEVIDPQSAEWKKVVEAVLRAAD